MYAALAGSEIIVTQTCIEVATILAKTIQRMSRVKNVFFMVWILSATHHHSDVLVQAQLDSFTAPTSGLQYLISNYTIRYNAGTSECARAGYEVGNFDSDTEFQDFLDDLNSGAMPLVTNETLWINVRKTSNTYFFGRGGVEIGNASWGLGEPSEDCGSCCYCILYNSTTNAHALADVECSELYHIFCSPVTNATTEVNSTTVMTTVATTVGVNSTETTASVATTIEVVTTPALSLSSGEQMTVIYLGLVIGGSLGISCCCATAWLVVNRTRRRFKKLEEKEEGDVEKRGRCLEDDDDEEEEEEGGVDGCDEEKKKVANAWNTRIYKNDCFVYDIQEEEEVEEVETRGGCTDANENVEKVEEGKSGNGENGGGIDGDYQDNNGGGDDGGDNVGDNGGEDNVNDNNGGVDNDGEDNGVDDNGGGDYCGDGNVGEEDVNRNTVTPEDGSDIVDGDDGEERYYGGTGTETNAAVENGATVWHNGMIFA